MNRDKCRICGKLLVPAYGVQKGVLLVGEYPGVEELKSGVPFVGKAGEVLRFELTRAGIYEKDCRMTNLWLHSMTDDCDPSFHKDELAREIAHAQYILMMGSELSKTFFDCGIMEVSGLSLKHEAFSGKVFYLSPNPAQIFHSPIGEFRNALEKFSSAVRKGRKS